jgi:hypothetical protein
MGSAVSTDVGQSSGQQMERVTAIHYPTRVQIQRPYMLGSVDPRYDSGQVLGLQSGYNDISNDLMSEFHEVSPLERTHAAVIDRIPNRTRSLPEEVFPSSLDHRVEAPERVKTGRRRRISGNGAPDGWVASKNLISERRRREKLQKGLITLRELVPMFNRKVSFTWDTRFQILKTLFIAYTLRICSLIEYLVKSNMIWNWIDGFFGCWALMTKFNMWR